MKKSPKNEEDNTAISIEPAVSADSPSTEQSDNNTGKTVSVPESSPDGGKDNES